MSILSNFRLGGRRKSDDTQDTAPQVDPESQVVTDKDAGPNDKELADQIIDDGAPDKDAQTGVQKIQAITLTWTKPQLAALLGLIWLMFLTNGLRSSILYGLLPYVTSEWRTHSLMTTINIVSYAMTAAIYIPMAKLVDVWGRAEGFLLMVCSATLGLILMASSKSLAAFCAAQVFYACGFAGIIYVICVLAADVTNLKNRGLAFAFTSSPYMITAFAGSKAAEAFLENVNWRWGFGAFAIIIPCVTSPLYGVLKYNQVKAKKEGLLTTESSGRTFLQTIWYGIIEFDVLGIFLFGGGLTIFLLPFTLAASAPNGWKTGYIIGMIFTGFIMLILFGLHQVYVSPQPFLKREFLVNRSLVGACLINATYQMSYYCWNSYFTSFLQVVYNLKVSEAGYVNSTFQVVSGVLLFMVGYSIRRTGRFKWLFYIAIPLYVFSLGLMIHFRQPNGNIGYIIMCEIFISIGGSVFILCCQLIVLAAVDHQHVAAALATLFVSGTIGGSVGNAVCGTIWTNTFLPALMRNLPEEALANVAMIYGDIVTQLSYPVGSDERLAIQRSYGYAQTRMLAAGTGLMCLSFGWILLVKNYNVAKMTQTKGVVF